MIRLKWLKQVSEARPSQWEGETQDGQVIYFRYRYGMLQVGIGQDMWEAIDNSQVRTLGSEYAGTMTLEDLKQATSDLIDWEVPGGPS